MHCDFEDGTPRLAISGVLGRCILAHEHSKRMRTSALQHAGAGTPRPCTLLLSRQDLGAG
jgi:hypothetical protein